MSKFLKTITPVILLVFILVLPVFTLANGPNEKLDNVAGSSAYNVTAQDTSLPAIVGKVIGVFLVLLGVIFLGLIVYAGFMWMIAAGNEDKVTKSKDTMRRAVIGLIIVIGAYAISQFIVYTLVS